MTEKQLQKSGDNSTNVQAGNIIINQGISYSEAKEIAIDVFKNNFIELSSSAAEEASKRVEEFVEDYLTKLKSKNPNLLENVKDPGLQYSIFEAQKSYARTGDKDLFNLLVNVLLDRTENTKRDLKQIVLDESLSIAPKLTREQLDALTLIFLIKYSIHNGLGNLTILNDYLKREFSPFCVSLSKELSCYQHLEYVGCGSVSIGGAKIEKIFRQNYSGLFSNGFESNKFETEIGPIPTYQNILIVCLRDPNKIQTRGLNEDELKKLLEKGNISENIRPKIIQLFNQSIMDEPSIKDDLISRGDFMKTLFDVWDNSSMNHMTITSVGVSLAQANYHIKTGQLLDLSMWIK
ncbi:MAG TPA: hypothetical protein PKE38_07765 [Ignavibacteriaceae bacterium]|nr:hypothetical protein [Ignavibacteriaceae bacterium]